MCQEKWSKRSFTGQGRWCDYFGQTTSFAITACLLGCLGALTNGLIILGNDRFEIWLEFLNTRVETLFSLFLWLTTLNIK